MTVATWVYRANKSKWSTPLSLLIQICAQTGIDLLQIGRNQVDDELFDFGGQFLGHELGNTGYIFHFDVQLSGQHNASSRSVRKEAIASFALHLILERGITDARNIVFESFWASHPLHHFRLYDS